MPATSRLSVVGSVLSPADLSLQAPGNLEFPLGLLPVQSEVLKKIKSR